MKKLFFILPLFISLTACFGDVEVDPIVYHPTKLCADKDAGDACGAEGYACDESGTCAPPALTPDEQCGKLGGGAPCGDGGTCAFSSVACIEP